MAPPSVQPSPTPPAQHPAPTQDPAPTRQDTVSPPNDLPTPPGLSANTIDCDAVEGPCDRGDDPELDRLWEDCADGAGGACDRLYHDAGFDTRYEQFGNTCGDRGLTVPCPANLEGTSA